MQGEKEGLEGELRESRMKVKELEDQRSAAEADMAEKKKGLKSVENEKSVLAARVQGLKNKAREVEELREKVKSLKEGAGKAGHLEKQLASATQKVSSLQLTNDSMVDEMKRLRKQAHDSTSSLSDLTKKHDSLTKAHSTATTDLQVALAGNQSLTATCNSLRQKSSSIAKDLSRLTKGGRSVKELEKMIVNFDRMRIDNSILKAEKKHAEETMMEYKEAAEMHADARAKGMVDGEAERALQQRSELERIIASLTETIQTKEMQIDLMRDVNRKLAGELQEARGGGGGGDKSGGSIQTTMSVGSDVTEESFSDLIADRGGADFSDIGGVEKEEVEDCPK